MTPVPLTKLSVNDEDISPDANSFLLDDSNSIAADDIQKHSGWPFVEYVVSTVEELKKQNIYVVDYIILILETN